MTRADWTEIAHALGQLHGQLMEHADRGNRVAHLERAIGVELAARAICRTLRARSGRFDARRFLRLVAGNAK